MCSSRVRASFLRLKEAAFLSTHRVQTCFAIFSISVPAAWSRHACRVLGNYDKHVHRALILANLAQISHSVQIDTIATFAAFNSKASKVDSGVVHWWHQRAVKWDVSLMEKGLKERSHMPATEPHLTHPDLHNRFFISGLCTSSPFPLLSGKTHQSTAAATPNCLKHSFYFL